MFQHFFNSIFQGNSFQKSIKTKIIKLLLLNIPELGHPEHDPFIINCTIFYFFQKIKK